MLKDAIKKVKNIFKGKKTFDTSNYDDRIGSLNVNSNVNNSEIDLNVSYFGSEEYKLEMFKSELRYKLVPQGDGYTSLQKEYVDYVERKLSTITLNDKDSYNILTWNEWLTNELDNSCQKFSTLKSV